MFFRVEAVRPLGFFREDLAIHTEDSDLCYRLRARGWKLWYVPKARLYHRVSLTMGEGSPATYYYFTRNMLAFHSRHRVGPFWPLPLISFLCLATPAASLRFLLRGRPRGFLEVWRGVADWVRGRYGIRY